MPRPMPERLTVAGLPLMLPSMKSAAVRVPGAEGVKLTWMVQLAAAARAAPQVSVSEKSALFSPPITTPPRFSVAVPLLVSFRTWAAPGAPTVWLPKLRFATDKAGAGASKLFEMPS